MFSHVRFYNFQFVQKKKEVDKLFKYICYNLLIRLAKYIKNVKSSLAVKIKIYYEINIHRNNGTDNDS